MSDLKIGDVVEVVFPHTSHTGRIGVIFSLERESIRVHFLDNDDSRDIESNWTWDSSLELIGNLNENR